MCSKPFLRESWSWSSSFFLPRADFQRTMTICAACLSRGNLGHGHRLVLSHFFLLCEDFLAFSSVFPFFPMDFGGSAGKKILGFWWFSLHLSKKARKRRSGS